jgi:hypothetical protein
MPLHGRRTVLRFRRRLAGGFGSGLLVSFQATAQARKIRVESVALRVWIAVGSDAGH